MSSNESKYVSSGDNNSIPSASNGSNSRRNCNTHSTSTKRNACRQDGSQGTRSRNSVSSLTNSEIEYPIVIEDDLALLRWTTATAPNKKQRITGEDWENKSLIQNIAYAKGFVHKRSQVYQPHTPPIVELPTGCMVVLPRISQPSMYRLSVQQLGTYDDILADTLVDGVSYLSYR
jgi:hypothetical protein